MTAISPGDEVTVTITGTVDRWMPNVHFLRIERQDGQFQSFATWGPDVKVTVLRPDRPTRREVLEQHPERSLRGGMWQCKGCGRYADDWAQHLDAVLTKWEEK